MSSVTKRIASIKQPYGGYISPNKFECIQLEDSLTLSEEENIHSSLIGMTIDYMTRFMVSNDANKSFEISLLGAASISKESIANELIQGVKGLDDNSIINACKLSGFDVCYRSAVNQYKPIEKINPDSKTVENIRTMVNRCLTFIRLYGPIVKEGFTFDGGYTEYINVGDGDYLTKDTLWDFKVSKRGPTNKHTLQLLVYYLLGIHSIYPEFDKVKKLGVFNPRLNNVYILSIDSIPKDVIDDVSIDVIGYGTCKKLLYDMKVNASDKRFLNKNQYAFNTGFEREKELTVADISKDLNVNKNTVYKWIRSGALYAEKRKNKYYVKLSDFEDFMKIRRQRIYIGVFVVVVIFIIYIWFFTSVI